MVQNKLEKPSWYFEWNRAYTGWMTRFSLDSRTETWQARIRTDFGHDNTKYAVYVGTTNLKLSDKTWFKSGLTLDEAIHYWDSIMPEVRRITNIDFPKLSNSPYIDEYRKITEQLIAADEDLRRNPPSSTTYERRIAELLKGLENFESHGLRKLD